MITGEVDLLPFLAGLPIGLLIGLILYINQFPDMEADARVGKNHWVVRLGRKKASAGYPIILGITYGCVGVAVLLALMPPFVLLFLLIIPLALKASKTVLENAENVRAAARASHDRLDPSVWWVVAGGGRGVVCVSTLIAPVSYSPQLAGLRYI